MDELAGGYIADEFSTFEDNGPVNIVRDEPNVPRLPRIANHPILTLEILKKKYHMTGWSFASVKAAAKLNTDTMAAAKTKELVEVMLRGLCETEITKEAHPDVPNNQKALLTAQHKRMDDIVTVKENSFTGAWVIEQVERTDFIRGCLNLRREGQILKLGTQNLAQTRQISLLESSIYRKRKKA